MRNKPQFSWRKALYEHPVSLIGGLFLAGILLVFLGSFYAKEREERSFVAYSEHLMQTFVDQEIREQEKVLRDYAVWDEMAEKVHGENADLDWLEKNITESVYRNLGVNDALVLTASLRPVYNLHRGERINLKQLADWNADFSNYLAQALASNPDIHSLSGMVRTQGSVQILTAEQIRPEHALGKKTQAGGWIIYTHNLDASWQEDTSRLLSIQALHVVEQIPQDEQPSFALQGLNREPIAWFSWQVSRGQGKAATLWPLMAAMLALFLFVILLARSVLKMHKRQIAVQSRMLAQSESLRHLAYLPHGAEDEARYLNEIANTIQSNLASTRTTLWRNDVLQGHFSCVAVSGEAEKLDAPLSLRQYPEYFHHLAEARILAIPNVGEDHRVANLADYWQLHGVISTLDVGIMIRGQLAGVICVEVCGDARNWEQDQINFVTATADLVAVAFESAERERIEAALHRQQFYDALTGLPNPERLSQLLHQEMLQPGTHVAYSLWSVGGLFHINEELGRVYGDCFLQELARRLDLSPDAHFTARVTGNRFVLAFLNLSEGQVSQEIERVFLRLQAPIELAGREIIAQLNCGVSLAPQDALTVEELQRHAEFALDSARIRNNAPIEYYAAEPNALARERYQLAGALPAALSHGEFDVHFQPLVDLHTKRIVGAEALLRWHHPEKGSIPPGQFISIAEETGHIHALGRFVLEYSCRVLRDWIDKLGHPIVLAVNVSPLQLREPRFMSFIEGLLRQYNLQAQWLEIEITESLSIELFEHAPATLEQLHQMGISLSIDDFGTGYSSLSYLRHLPASKLKIDRSFIEHVPEVRQDADLARMIISLGHILGMTIVGEGIETEEQLLFLRDQGCQIGQGFLFSRPINAAAFNLLLQHGLLQKE